MGPEVGLSDGGSELRRSEVGAGEVERARPEAWGKTNQEGGIEAEALKLQRLLINNAKPHCSGASGRGRVQRGFASPRRLIAAAGHLATT